MKKISCLIIDDEPPARQVLENHIQKIAQLELAGKCKDAFAAVDFLHRQRVDLLFLDIKMPELNGLDFLSVMPQTPKVILTTAYSEYALESYDYEVVDYLLKPIRFQRFLRAINRLLKPSEAVRSSAPAPSLKTSNYIFVNINKKMHRIFLSDILYIESLGNYVRIFTTKEKHMVHRAISAFDEWLPKSQFLRTHRSYLVSLSKISAFTQTNLEIGDHLLPIGGLYKQGFLKAMEKRGKVF